MSCSVKRHFMRSLILLSCAIYYTEGDRLDRNRHFSESYPRRRHESYCGASFGIGSFKCDSGECIEEDKLCDGKEDCRDGSDETRECINIIPCRSKFLFQCDYGACINKNLACNGKADCKDNSDESPSACKNRCGPQKFQCNSGQCINEHFLCDGVPDCPDSSDETVRVCAEIMCPAYTYRCRYGACVSARARCNGKEDCNDGSDEVGCEVVVPSTTTPEGPASAQPGPPPVLHCDKGKFRCNSSQCLSNGRICDGRADCSDHSDETSSLCSQIRCPSYTFRCEYGACVDRTARCNGIADCIDNSDEKGCSNVQPTKVPESSSTAPDLPLTENSCVTPVNPGNGAYSIGGATHNTYSPFSEVPLYSVLLTSCNQGYIVSPPEETPSICLSGTWTPPPGACLRPCPILTSMAGEVECKFKNKSLKSCTNAVDGTVAVVPCMPLESNPGIIQSLTHVCKDGKWDNPVAQCLSGQHINPNNSVVNVFYIFNRDSVN